MKKILLLIDELGQGGAERQMVYLAKELKKANCNVRLVKFFSGETPYKNILDENGIIVETNIKGRNRWKRVTEITKITRAWEPDLTIAYKDGTCIASCLAKLIHKFKLVVSERNTTQILSYRERFKFWIYKLADYIVPNSDSQTKFITQHFPSLASKVVTITNMIDTDRFQPLKGITTTKKRVLISARITPQKNVIKFLEALHILSKRVNDVHFDWYGKVKDYGYYEEIKIKQNAMGLNEYISFHTEGTTQIEEEYRRSTHFCLPSKYEGFPNALCEAMATGLVCCASNICDNSFILNQKQLLFNPLNPHDIADKLEYALNLSSSDISDISHKNITRILNFCSSDNFIKRYLSLIQ